MILNDDSVDKQINTLPSVGSLVEDESVDVLTEEVIINPVRMSKMFIQFDRLITVRFVLRKLVDFYITLSETKRFRVKSYPDVSSVVFIKSP